MSTLSEMRESIKALVQRDDLPASTTVPARGARGPCVFVSPGVPYITPEGANFHQSVINHEVLVVGPAGVAQEQADRLDELILQVLGDLYADDDLDVGDVGRPVEVTLNGQGPYLAAPITVSAQRPIGGATP